MHFGDNSGKRQCNICILGIIRVYRDISSSTFSRTRTYMNVREVEVYDGH